MSNQSDDNNLLNFIVATLEGMREQIPTKSDLTQLETRLVNKLESEITAVRGDIEQVNMRLDTIERTLTYNCNSDAFAPDSTCILPRQVV